MTCSHGGLKFHALLGNKGLNVIYSLGGNSNIIPFSYWVVKFTKTIYGNGSIITQTVKILDKNVSNRLFSYNFLKKSFGAEKLQSSYIMA